MTGTFPPTTPKPTPPIIRGTVAPLGGKFDRAELPLNQTGRKFVKKVKGFDISYNGATPYSIFPFWIEVTKPGWIKDKVDFENKNDRNKFQDVTESSLISKISKKVKMHSRKTTIIPTSSVKGKEVWSTSSTQIPLTNMPSNDKEKKTSPKMTTQNRALTTSNVNNISSKKYLNETNTRSDNETSLSTKSTSHWNNTKKLSTKSITQFDNRIIASTEPTTQSDSSTSLSTESTIQANNSKKVLTKSPDQAVKLRTTTIKPNSQPDTNKPTVSDTSTLSPILNSELDSQQDKNITTNTQSEIQAHHVNNQNKASLEDQLFQLLDKMAQSYNNGNYSEI